VTTRFVGMASVALAALGILLVSLERSGASCIDALDETARAHGGSIEIGAVERNLFDSKLHDVRLGLRHGVTIRAPVAYVQHGLLGDSTLDVPDALITARAEPRASFETLYDFLASPTPPPMVGALTLDFLHRSLRGVQLDGLSGSASERSLSLRAETVHVGAAMFSDTPLAVSSPHGILTVDLGATKRSGPRATARYAPSDGRAAEWLVDIPHQSFAALRAALRLGRVRPEDHSHIAGTVSWIVPDDPTLSSRGSARFVVDQWYRPDWPEASALTGSTGSLAARIVPEPSGTLRLERVEVGAAVFALEGTGTISAEGEVTASLDVSGRRTCSQLSENLAPSRYRQSVHAFLEQTRPNATAVSDGSVELRLVIDLRTGNPGWARFAWHLTAGCGLDELSGTTEGPA